MLNTLNAIQSYLSGRGIDWQQSNLATATRAATLTGISLFGTGCSSYATAGAKTTLVYLSLNVVAAGTLYLFSKRHKDIELYPDNTGGAEHTKISSQEGG